MIFLKKLQLLSALTYTYRAYIDTMTHYLLPRILLYNSIVAELLNLSYALYLSLHRISCYAK